MRDERINALTSSMGCHMWLIGDRVLANGKGLRKEQLSRKWRRELS
jgi:hypothetical protein